jgi:hypothetical protein
VAYGKRLVWQNQKPDWVEWAILTSSSSRFGTFYVAWSSSPVRCVQPPAVAATAIDTSRSFRNFR